MKKFIVSLMVVAAVCTFSSCKEESAIEKAGTTSEAAADDAKSEMKKAEGEINDAAKDVKVPEVK